MKTTALGYAALNAGAQKRSFERALARPRRGEQRESNAHLQSVNCAFDSLRSPSGPAKGCYFASLRLAFFDCASLALRVNLRLLLRFAALRLVTHMDVGDAASPFGAGVALTFTRYVFTRSVSGAGLCAVSLRIMADLWQF